MSLYFSNRNITVQFIDDVAARTIAAYTTTGTGAKLNVSSAREAGAKAAEAALAKGISLVVVDRGGFSFAGRVKALVDAAIEAGLKITDKATAEEEA